jgi:hypothetical protein
VTTHTFLFMTILDVRLGDLAAASPRQYSHAPRRGYMKAV